MTVVIDAAKAGPCEQCDFGIRAGQKITPLVDGGWAHTRCPEARPLCGECFTPVTPSGACMCGAV